MAAGDMHVAALGRLEADPGAPWVGLARDGRGYALVRGDADGVRRLAATTRRDLYAAALAFITEGLADPPPELEATHADLAGLLAWLRDTAPTPADAALLREALDALDDGLAEDVLVHRLARAAEREGALTPNEQADDWVGLLEERLRSIGGA